mmetsp:Transcript_13870/g.22982  ORF Transcript_13870/g.22982 Transcript_13870/m.22982 type:complete len:230 (+) Transcript_13870:522-1211(+)
MFPIVSGRYPVSPVDSISSTLRLVSDPNECGNGPVRAAMPDKSSTSSWPRVARLSFDRPIKLGNVPVSSFLNNDILFREEYRPKLEGSVPIILLSPSKSSSRYGRPHSSIGIDPVRWLRAKFTLLRSCSNPSRESSSPCTLFPGKVKDTILSSMSHRTPYQKHSCSSLDHCVFFVQPLPPPETNKHANAKRHSIRSIDSPTPDFSKAVASVAIQTKATFSGAHELTWVS